MAVKLMVLMVLAALAVFVNAETEDFNAKPNGTRQTASVTAVRLGYLCSKCSTPVIDATVTGRPSQMEQRFIATWHMRSWAVPTSSGC